MHRWRRARINKYTNFRAGHQRAPPDALGWSKRLKPLFYRCFRMLLDGFLVPWPGSHHHRNRLNFNAYVKCDSVQGQRKGQHAFVGEAATGDPALPALQSFPRRICAKKPRVPTSFLIHLRSQPASRHAQAVKPSREAVARNVREVYRSRKRHATGSAIQRSMADSRQPAPLIGFEL